MKFASPFISFDSSFKFSDLHFMGLQLIQERLQLI